MDELAHYGIPNMRWGVRRYQDKDGKLTPAGKERYRKNPESDESKRETLNKIKKFATLGRGWPKKVVKSIKEHKDAKSSDDREQTSENDNKPVEEMSDAELRQRLNRLNMEQQYKALNPGKVQSGYDAAKKVLAVAGTVTLAVGTVIKAKNQIDTISKWFRKG